MDFFSDRETTLNREWAAEADAVPANIRELSVFAENALKEADAPATLAAELLMALDEAVTNVVMHAYETGPVPGGLKLVIRRERDAFTAELIDQGREFNPATHPDPDLNVPLEEREAGGMGIKMIRQMTDAMKYRRTRHDNHLVLIKKMRRNHG